MHALNGTWVANLERSKRDPNHQFQSATMRVDVRERRVTLTYGGVNGSGCDERGVQTIEADGEEHLIAEAPGFVAVATLDPRALHAVGKKDGEVVSRGSYEVSDDGLTLTATVSGLDAGGRPFDQVVVFDRG